MPLFLLALMRYSTTRGRSRWAKFAALLFSCPCPSTTEHRHRAPPAPVTCSAGYANLKGRADGNRELGAVSFALMQASTAMRVVLGYGGVVRPYPNHRI